MIQAFKAVEMENERCKRVQSILELQELREELQNQLYCVLKLMQNSTLAKMNSELSAGSGSINPASH
jgi:hypothetical protein